MALGVCHKHLFPKTMKRYILLIALSIFSLNAIHAEITWTLSDDGTLTISGTDMPDYNNAAPWYPQRDNIKKVIIENGVTKIGSYAFCECSDLTSITIPNSVTSIGFLAFAYCSSPISVTLPESVTSIGNYAFYGCSGLTSVTIPNSVMSIGRAAFYGCSSLTSITIPKSVMSIESGAFGYCYELSSIIVDKGNPIYDSRNDCNAIIETKSNTLIKGCKNTVIPNSVMSIGDGAFSYCSGLTSITIPNSVTSIGDSAFYNCPDFTSIIVEQGNKNYDSRNDCNAIIETESNTLIIGCKNTIISNSVASIGNYAFQDCI